MKKIFGYDSKIMQFLGTLCDLIFLNILFIVCSIPIFTMGASWAGLYSGVRALREESETGKSCYAAFFEGFKNGFWRVTAAWCMFFVVAYLLSINLVNLYVFKVVDPDAPIAMSIVGLVFLLLFMTMIPLFHSRFGCTVFQLVRNAVVLIVCTPVAALIITALTWVPLVVFLANTALFITITPLWILGYFSVVAYLAVFLFRNPFRMLEDNFKESHASEDAVGTEETEGLPE